MSKISVLKVAREAIAACFGDPAAILKLILPVVGILVFAEAALGELGSPSAVPGLIVEAYLVFLWHRKILLRKKVGILGLEKGTDPRVAMRLQKEAMGGFFWRVAAFAVVIYIVALLSGLVGIRPLVAEGNLLPPIIAAGAALFVGPAFFRVALIFPAAAIGSPKNTVVDVWRLSEGNGLFITLAYLVVGIPAALFWVLFALFFPEVPPKSLLYIPGLSAGPLEFYTILATWIAATCLTVVLWASVNSAIYRALGAELRDFLAEAPPEPLAIQDGGAQKAAVSPSSNAVRASKPAMPDLNPITTNNAGSSSDRPLEYGRRKGRR